MGSVSKVAGLDEFFPPLLGFFLKVRGDGLGVEGGTQVFRLPAVGLHGHEIDHALEAVLGTDGDLQRQRLGTQLGFHLLDAGGEVGTRSIHLVDEGHARHFIGVGLAPHGFRLGLDATHGTEDDDRAVEYTKGSLHLYCEIHMSGGVDEVDVVFLPGQGRDRRGDGDAAFLFLGHPVHDGLPIVNLSHAVDDACVIEKAFADRGLACIDVGDDADVACSQHGLGRLLG